MTNSNLCDPCQRWASGQENTKRKQRKAKLRSLTTVELISFLSRCNCLWLASAVETAPDCDELLCFHHCARDVTCPRRAYGKSRVIRVHDRENKSRGPKSGGANFAVLRGERSLAEVDTTIDTGQRVSRWASFPPARAIREITPQTLGPSTVRAHVSSKTDRVALHIEHRSLAQGRAASALAARGIDVCKKPSEVRSRLEGRGGFHPRIKG